MNDAHTFDPDLFRRTASALDTLTRTYYRYRLRGTERIPEAPCLFVGNHSGLGIAEVLCMWGALYRTFGTDRPVAGLMHDTTYDSALMGGFYQKMGAVRASRASALAAFEAGRDVLVFPGGDLDAARPFYEPRTVHFGTRRGYVRLALEAGVPVVPIATIGSHYTFLNAPGGQTLAQALGLKRKLRLERVPMPLSGGLLALTILGLATGRLSTSRAALMALVAAAPTPVRITSEILPPVDLGNALDTDHTEAQRLEAGHALIHGALQDAVATMTHKGPSSSSTR